MAWWGPLPTFWSPLARLLSAPPRPAAFMQMLSGILGLVPAIQGPYRVPHLKGIG